MAAFTKELNRFILSKYIMSYVKSFLEHQLRVRVDAVEYNYTTSRVVSESYKCNQNSM